MKRLVCLLLALACSLCALEACAEIGFAEVKPERVNFRDAPGGALIDRLPQNWSVYVFEEKTVNGQLWCHVFTSFNKWTTDCWIRGDMLRFVSEEFTDVVSVQAGHHYVTGLRADGTVAIMGNDMPHMPCLETVRSWTGIEQVSSWICEAYGLKNGEIQAIGRGSRYQGLKAALFCGDVPILMNGEGCLLELPETYGEVPEAFRDLPLFAVQGRDGQATVVLTAEGDVLIEDEMLPVDASFENAPYTDISMFWNHVLALRADGKVDAVGENGSGQCDVTGWEHVVKVSAGNDHSLGLKEDGTVYYAGNDENHARQVATWTDIVDLDAGHGISIALDRAGRVFMAGAFRAYDR